MTKEEVLRKIHLLLKLQESPNEEEASAAAGKAFELLVKYNLSLAEIDLTNKTLSAQEQNRKPAEEPVGDETVEEVGSNIQWRGSLLATVARAYFCKSWYERPRQGWDSKSQKHKRTVKGKYHLIGRPANVAVAKEMFQYLAEVIERLSREALALAKLNYGHRYDFNSKSYNDSFRRGAVIRIYHRLQEQQNRVKREGVEGDRSTALAIVNLEQQETTAIQRYMEAASLRLHTIKNRDARDRRGYDEGYNAAGKINLDPQVKPGPGHKALKGE